MFIWDEKRGGERTLAPRPFHFYLHKLNSARSNQTFLSFENKLTKMTVMWSHKVQAGSWAKNLLGRCLIVNGFGMLLCT